MEKTDDDGVPTIVFDQPSVTYPKMSIGALVAELEFIAEKQSQLASRRERLLALIRALEGDCE